MERKPRNAFVTARKGFCYLTIKSFGRNHEMMRIRNYKLDAENRRRMRRLYQRWLLTGRKSPASSP